MGSIEILSVLYMLVTMTQSQFFHPLPFVGYDYIIVGAGSAGSALASRLSEDFRSKILLLEAGGFSTNISQVPLFANQLWNTSADWNYTVVEQANACFGFLDHRCFLSAGRMLGGGSGLDSMIYARGNAYDYNYWAESGAYGWGYNDVLPYFIRAEDMMIPFHHHNFIESSFHGFGGPLTISHPGFISNLQQAYIQAGQSIGFDHIDFNGHQQSGIGQAQFTMRNGQRCGVEKAYLEPTHERENLDIVKDAHVTKVLFDKDKTATKVMFEKEGKTYMANAKREIILSAGAYNTPQILMLSGIGPKEHLESLGINVISNLPVGLNLQDHIGSFGLFYTINTTDGIVPSKYEGEEFLKQFKKGVGPLTAPGLEALAFFKSKFEKTAGDYPDAEIMMSSLLWLQNLGLDPKFLEFFEEYKHKDIFSLLSVALHTKSKGSVKLNSTNPMDKPIIDYQYFSEKEDVEVVVEGMKKAMELAKSEPLQKFGAEMIKLPVCEEFELGSEEFLTCLAKTFTTTMWQPTGTCKMGRLADPLTVVDPMLRVKGVRGLRVVDCSVIPSPISGHLNAAAIMIGEKAADMIKYNEQYSYHWFQQFG